MAVRSASDQRRSCVPALSWDESLGVGRVSGRRRAGAGEGARLGVSSNGDAMTWLADTDVGAAHGFGRARRLSCAGGRWWDLRSWSRQM